MIYFCQTIGRTQQTERIKKDWESYAKEKLEVEQLSGAVYAYGSELATLRLLKKYWGNKKVKQDYSTNKKTFFFRLEMR